MPGSGSHHLNRREIVVGAAAIGAVCWCSGRVSAQAVLAAKGETAVVVEPYTGPAGGWGSVKSVAKNLFRQEIPLSGTRLLWVQNKPEGFKCVSCAWAKPADHHPFEFCENGAKATLWEATAHRAGTALFAAHTCRDLEQWTDHDLENTGRLTHPMRWDRASDKYFPVSWDAAIAEIGAELKRCDPKRVVCYTSGRAALETAYMFQLFARLHGHNNLPDSSNMCHESTSVGLPESIGSAVGTGTLEDFKHCDLLINIGHNSGVNSPRMLHEYQRVRERGIPFIVLNPLRERGQERFTNPQRPLQMVTLSETTIATQYCLIKSGGDSAALIGICKAVIALDDEAKAANRPRVVDVAFIETHTQGFEAFAAYCRQQSWDRIVADAGLTREDIDQVANAYVKSRACLAVYGMGITQQTRGVENVQMVVNLLLLRGNIGKPGGNVIPVRGHSNVQGQRTVGITEKPELAPLDKLAQQFGFEPPRDTGMHTVKACEAIVKGELQAFIGLGGNFIRAVPDTVIMEAAWRKIPLTVQISTKLNRNHVIHGEVAYILPCLGRTEIDRQATGPQAVTMEDSTAHFHGSKGYAEPASADLKSEPWIVAAIAKATLAANAKVPWEAWVADYSKIRDAMEQTYDTVFKNFNARIWKPGGVERPVPARSREWKTKSGRAKFIVPVAVTPDPRLAVAVGRDVLQLTTVRSNDQFNTTVYGYSDRFRGIEGTRMVVFMNRQDVERLGFKNGQTVDLTTAIGDETKRQVKGFRIVLYPITAGCIAAYFPEATPLVPLWHQAIGSNTPVYKGIPVHVMTSEGTT